MEKVVLGRRDITPNRVTRGETTFLTFLCKTPTIYTTTRDEGLSLVPDINRLAEARYPFNPR